MARPCPACGYDQDDANKQIVRLSAQVKDLQRALEQRSPAESCMRERGEGRSPCGACSVCCAEYRERLQGLEAEIAAVIQVLPIDTAITMTDSIVAYVRRHRENYEALIGVLRAALTGWSTWDANGCTCGERYCRHWLQARDESRAVLDMVPSDAAQYVLALEQYYATVIRFGIDNARERAARAAVESVRKR